MILKLEKSILLIMIYLIMFISISTITYGEAPAESLSETKIAQAKEWFDKATILQEKDKAIEACTKALELNPTYVEAYELRARLYENKKEYYLARIDYTKLIELDSKAAEHYYFERGLIFEAEKNYDDAKNDYSKAIELNPKFIKAYLERGGLLHYPLKKYNEAINDFTKLIELEPDCRSYYSRRASSYELNMQTDLAIKDYSKLIELEPSVELYIQRARLYEKNSQYDMAINDYTKAMELHELSYMYIRRAAAYDKLGRSDLAQADRIKAEERRKAEKNWEKEYGTIIVFLIPLFFIVCLFFYCGRLLGK